MFSMVQFSQWTDQSIITKKADLNLKYLPNFIPFFLYVCVCLCVSLDVLSCSLSVTFYIRYAFSDSEMYSMICFM